MNDVHTEGSAAILVEIEGRKLAIGTTDGTGFRSPEEVWVGMDIDSCLASFDYEKWSKDNFWIGDPIPSMVERIKTIEALGIKVKLFTARVGGWYTGDGDEREHAKKQFIAINWWCEKHFDRRFEITAVKDYNCLFVYDDASEQVKPNTGVTIRELITKLTGMEV
jgi:hypothetical protein